VVEAYFSFCLEAIPYIDDVAPFVSLIGMLFGVKCHHLGLDLFIRHFNEQKNKKGNHFFGIIFVFF